MEGRMSGDLSLRDNKFDGFVYAASARPMGRVDPIFNTENTPYSRAIVLRAHLTELRNARERITSGSSVELQYTDFQAGVKVSVDFPADLVRQNLFAEIEKVRAELRRELIAVRDEAVKELETL